MVLYTLELTEDLSCTEVTSKSNVRALSETIACTENLIPGNPNQTYSIVISYKTSEIPMILDAKKEVPTVLSNSEA